jgi:murein DD-endopeptidase MepM/ murein hydrolase activator NlpD
MADPQTSDTDDVWDKIRKALQQIVQEQKPDSLLGQLLQSFLSFLSGIDDDTQDIEDGEGNSVTDPTAREAAERDYERRSPTEEKEYGNFKDSAKGWTASSMAETSAALVKLREQAERANGGQHVKAVAPVQGQFRITSGFGHRESPGGIGSTEHAGLDIAPKTPGDTNVTVVSTMPGVVVGVGKRGGYGNMVEIMDIYGVKHRYGHLAHANVKPGDVVKQGEPIAIMGSTGRSTGIHLHYEQRDAKNIARNPLLDMDINGHGVGGVTESKPFIAPPKKESTPQVWKTVEAHPAPLNLHPQAQEAAKAAAKLIAPVKQPVPVAQQKHGFHVSDVVDGVTHGVSLAFANARSAIGNLLG